MGMSDEDRAEMANLVQKCVTAAVAAVAPPPCPPKGGGQRTYAEVGSPEFAEDRTQINSLNNKWIFESAMSDFWRDRRRSDDHYADLQSRGLDSLTESVQLQKKLNSKFFEVMDDTRREGYDKRSLIYAKAVQGTRWEDDNAYNTRYDLANPTSLGVADNVRGGMVSANRAIDTNAAALGNIQTAIEAVMVQAQQNSANIDTAVKAAMVDAMNGTIPTLQAAIGAAIAAALVNTPTKPAA